MAVLRQYQYIPADYDPLIGELTARQATSFKVTGTGFVSVWTGFGFKYDAQGYLTDGRIEGTTWQIGGRVAFKIEDLGITIAALRLSTDPADLLLADADTYYGHRGDDVMNLGRGNDTYFAGSGRDTLTELGAGADKLYGQAGSDNIHAGGGADVVDGGGHEDTLYGEAGNDTIIGGHGRDHLFGGQGADRFVYKALKESVTGTLRDVIYDFARGQGDKIDLSAIDANGNTAGNGTFKFIGAKAFGGTHGELRFADSIVSGDANGDRVADFEIRVESMTPLSKADFIL